MATACARWMFFSTKSSAMPMGRRVYQHCCTATHRAAFLPSVRLQYASGRSISGSQPTQTSPKKSRLWKFLLLSAGAGAVYAVYRLLLLAETVPTPAKNWQVTLYRKLPLKALSRTWGRVNSVELPVFLRSPLLSVYVWAFGCRLDEAEVEDLKHYKNLGEFFRRALKPHVRPVDNKHELTSPSDGKVLYFGKVEGGKLEQVKGVTYSLHGFLGPSSWNSSLTGETTAVSDADYQRQMGVKPGHELLHCIIYLAPGDYHRFHSPASWNVVHRRHFPGDLLSVSPAIARLVQGLFNFNERVVYTGTWQHGFFSMCAVGATNVGSIKIYCDEDLETNTKGRYPDGTHFDKIFSSALDFPRGTLFGEFNLGSTIVLVFEAPKGFEFKIKPGQKIKFGEPIGTTP